MKRIKNILRMSDPNINWMHLDYSVTRFEIWCAWMIYKLRTMKGKRS